MAFATFVATKLKKMKKILLNLFAFSTAVLFTANAIAQCTPASSSTLGGGFFPADSTQPCVIRNVSYNATMQVENFGVINTSATVVSLRVDTIYNLPSGLTWAMNQPTGNAANTLLTAQIGCIQFSGTTTQAVGIANLDFGVTVVVNLSGTEQTFVNKTSVLVELFNSTFGGDYDFDYRLFIVENANDCTNSVGIEEIANVSNLNIYPNPFSNKALISFNALVNEKYTARLFDVMGKAVYEETLQANSGNNSFELNKKDISNGVYFFTLTNGKATETKRVIVE